MTKLFSLMLPLLLLVGACTHAQQSKSKLDAAGFSKLMTATPGAILLDVRTPDEYSSGYIPGAINIDWNSDAFDRQTAGLDKSKPLFVYCHSGRRSAAAAEQLRKEGFGPVYELRGGIVQWRKEGLRLQQQTDDAGLSNGQ